MKRILLYCKDVQTITGKSERASRELLRKIKIYFNKESHHAVTVDELCEYLGIKPESLPALL
jgi:hypothetical protein